MDGRRWQVSGRERWSSAGSLSVILEASSHEEAVARFKSILEERRGREVDLEIFSVDEL